MYLEILYEVAVPVQQGALFALITATLESETLLSLSLLEEGKKVSIRDLYPVMPHVCACNLLSSDQPAMSREQYHATIAKLVAFQSSLTMN